VKPPALKFACGYEAGPHEMVRSQQIVSSARRADVVPDELKKKIAGYVSFWR
jgi:hypothetical protein